MNLIQAKESLDKIIKKARVHLYKPIQIAEILYHHRTVNDIDLAHVETYRIQSRYWRDEICKRFLGRTSTSSMRYQDDVFNENAVPPTALVVLGEENIRNQGIVEAYIYRLFIQRQSHLSNALNYCQIRTIQDFFLQDFLKLFRQEAGLKRSLDKVYEIVVFALFSVIAEELKLTVEISLDESKLDILEEFSDFANRIIGLNKQQLSVKTTAKFYRVGITNAADRGLDMWANFGLAVQIKHLALDEELAEDIVDSITADRIVIVCKTAEQKLIISLLNQIGWKARIQSIITEDDLIAWYEKALRGKFSTSLGHKLLHTITEQIECEFPSYVDLSEFMTHRGYNNLYDNFWKLVE